MIEAGMEHSRRGPYLGNQYRFNLLLAKARYWAPRISRKLVSKFVEAFVNGYRSRVRAGSSEL